MIQPLPLGYNPIKDDKTSGCNLMNTSIERLFEIQRIILEQVEEDPYFWRSQFDSFILTAHKNLRKYMQIAVFS